MPNIEVKIDIEKDAWNWWGACNSSSYGVDWKERISKSLQNKISGKTKKEAYKFLFPYLAKLHKRVKLETEKNYAQKRFDEKQKQIFERMEEVTGRKICRENFIIFMTTFPRCPYNITKGYIWSYYKWGRGDYVDSFIHELLHFQTYAYWYEKCRKKLSNEDFEDLKEALTVILNESFSDIMTKPDCGYEVHKYLREELAKYWKKIKNFNSLVNYGVKIFPKFRDTIKYLQFGKYTANPPKALVNKIKKINKKFGENFIRKAFIIIMKNFNTKRYKITTAKSLKQSRLICVSDIMAKRQRTCGSLATVVASVFRTIGIPVKLIDGGYIEDNPNMNHAWNEIYDSRLKKFIA